MENKEKLSLIVKWAGGKEKELPIILENLPQSFENYYEPFVGGGSVFTAMGAMNAKSYFVNDKSFELIQLYEAIKNEDEAFFDYAQKMMNLWNAVLLLAENHTEIAEKYALVRNEDLTIQGVSKIFEDDFESLRGELRSIHNESFPKQELFISKIRKNLFEKIARMNALEKKLHILSDTDLALNIETGFLSGVYMYFRDLYNDDALRQRDKPLSVALFLFIRNYCYSGMFRYNAKGAFNVPYGGIGYNKKSLAKKLAYYKSAGLKNLLSKTQIFNSDFEDFFNLINPTENDFIFLDPPYDTEFSTYAKNIFDKSDQKRLAHYLIHSCKSKWMMIIKNTPFILSLYENHGLTISSFDKKYLVSFMNRNDKNTEHLLIRNY